MLVFIGFLIGVIFVLFIIPFIVFFILKIRKNDLIGTHIIINIEQNEDDDLEYSIDFAYQEDGYG